MNFSTVVLINFIFCKFPNLNMKALAGYYDNKLHYLLYTHFILWSFGFQQIYILVEEYKRKYKEIQ